MAEKPQRKPIARELIDRLVNGVRYIVTGAGPETWFGPGQPPQPQGEITDDGRILDYPVGYNQRQVPRGEEAVTFSQMRALADAYDLLRVVIETRKDQVVKFDWNIVPKDPKKKRDARCEEVDAFLSFPDGEHTWQQWLRAIIEDMLVIDAATIHPRLTYGNRPYKFEIFDGSTIKRVIDSRGATPEPPDPAYQQILHGVPAVNFSSHELIYAPRNVRAHKLYGYSPVEQIIMTVNIALRRQMHQLQYYTDGSTPDLIFQVPDNWKPDQVKQFKLWWDELLHGNTAGRRGTMFVPSGVAPVNTKDQVLKDEYDEWLARIVCYCFSLSSQPFVKQMNRATAEAAKEAATEDGLIPLLEWVKDLIDLIVWRYFGYTDLTFEWKFESDVDANMQSQIDDRDIRNGTISIDEVRQRRGLDPLGVGPAIITATGLIPVVESYEAELEALLNPPEPVVMGGAVVGPDGKPIQQPPADDEDDDQPPADDEAGADKIRKRKKKLRRLSRRRPATVRSVRNLTRVVVLLLKSKAPEIARQATAAVSERLEKGLSKAIDDDVRYVQGELDFESWAESADDVGDALRPVARDGGQQALAQVGIDDDEITDVVNRDAVLFASSRGAELVGKKLVDGELVDNPNTQYAITESTRDMLRGTIKQAMEEGWSNDRLADEIVSHYAFSTKRAMNIARTETAFADVAGNMIAYRASGVVEQKQWILGSEHDLDDVCNDNAAVGPIPIDQPFPSGDDGPPAHPGCVCDVLPVVADGATKIRRQLMTKLRQAMEAET